MTRCSGRRWNYRQLNAEANRLANALRADGVGKNDVVMFALLNSPEFVFCYLAAHKIGAIACPVNYRQGGGEIAQVIDDSRPRVFCLRRPVRRAVRPGAADCAAASRPEMAVLVAGKAEAPQPGRPSPLTGTMRRAAPKPTRPSTLTRISMTRRPGCIPPAPPAGPRACPSTTSTRSSRPTT